MRAAAVSLVVLALAAPARAQEFTYTAPGTLQAPGGGPLRVGAGNVDYEVHSVGMRFPIESAPAFPNSQIYGNGGYMGPGGSECDAANFAYPWHDNFCEERSWTVPMCPSGFGHQGQDIHASDCVDQVHWTVAAVNGTITYISGRDGGAGYMLRITGDDGRFYEYLHMRGYVVNVGDRVTRGQRLAKVSDDMDDTPTSVHLHFNIRITMAGYSGYVHVSPYMSLVRAYEELLGTPGRLIDDCGTIPAEGGIVDDGDSCFEAHGPGAYWRTVAAGTGGGLHWTDAWEHDAPGNWARWRLNFEAPGRYLVEANVDPTWGVYPATRYAIDHSGGETTQLVDQGTADGWVSLGTYDFDANGAVMVYDNYSGTIAADQHIVADAIRLTPYVEAVDAGSDAGVVMSGSDASTGADASAADASGGGPMPLRAGCACEAAGAGGGRSASLALLGVLAVVAVRRRRRPCVLAPR